MTEDPHALLDLLRRMESRGLKRASDLAAPAPRSAPPLDDILPTAQRITGADGQSCWLVRSTVELERGVSREGYQCPAARWNGPPDPETLAALTGDARWAGIAPGQVAYIDTETTGLATGSGTTAFLAGVGFFAGGRFELDQIFFDDPAGEPVALETLDQLLSRARAIVSYNGLSYDMPILETRWRLNRRKPQFPAMHLDLLFPARRLWRKVLESCSLGSIERHVLGIERHSDVPGALVPQIYFDYQHGLQPERMTGVFDHHAQDIFSLGALASLVAHLWREPGDPLAARAETQWGLAKWRGRLGDVEGALREMESAILAARDERLGFSMSMHLARMYCRIGRREEARAIWTARLGQVSTAQLDPLIELAKDAEHHLGDLEAALAHTRRAIAVLESDEQFRWLMDRALDDTEEPGRLRTLRGQLDQRRLRLEKRMARKKIGQGHAEENPEAD